MHHLNAKVRDPVPRPTHHRPATARLQSRRRDGQGRAHAVGNRFQRERRHTPRALPGAFPLEHLDERWSSRGPARLPCTARGLADALDRPLSETLD